MKLLLTIIAFMLVSFAVQGLSHFVINREHFASIAFMRADPILPMGLLAMVVQAMVLHYAMQAYKTTSVSIADGLKVSVAFGIFLAAYIVLAEPAKFAAPSVPAWITV